MLPLFMQAQRYKPQQKKRVYNEDIITMAINKTRIITITITHHTTTRIIREL